MILFGVYLLVGMVVFMATQFLRAIDRIRHKEAICFIEIFWQFIWLGLLFPFGLWVLCRKLTS